MIKSLFFLEFMLFDNLLAVGDGLQRKILYAVVLHILQFGAENIEVLLLFRRHVLEQTVRYGIVLGGTQTRELVVGIDGTLFEFHRKFESLAYIMDLPRLELLIHVHVAFEKENALGDMLDMAHLGNRDAAHQIGQMFIPRILEDGVEIHVLQRRGNLLAQRIVQSVDTFLILIGLFHNKKVFARKQSK